MSRIHAKIFFKSIKEFYKNINQILINCNHFKHVLKYFKLGNINTHQKRKVVWNWSEALVIPIFRPGKDLKLTDSFRPISLTSCLCKLMERMVNRRLVHILEERKLLPKQKFGFRKNQSTIDVLNILNTHITEAIRKGEYIQQFFHRTYRKPTTPVRSTAY
jgi:hypothetical protein